SSESSQTSERGAQRRSLPQATIQKVRFFGGSWVPGLLSTPSRSPSLIVAGPGKCSGSPHPSSATPGATVTVTSQSSRRFASTVRHLLTVGVDHEVGAQLDLDQRVSVEARRSVPTDLTFVEACGNAGTEGARGSFRIAFGRVGDRDLADGDTVHLPQFLVGG